MDTCVLFVHHMNDEVTARHYALLRQYNPDVAAVPLCWAGSPHLDGAVEIPAPVEEEGPNPLWRNCDRMLYRWFESAHRLEASRYLIIEWDTLITQPLSEFYPAQAWNAGFAASAVYAPQTIPSSEWGWWQELSEQQWQALGPYVRGCCPISGVLIERNLLERMSAAARLPVFHGMFCEARIATLAAYCGVEPIGIRPDCWGHIQCGDVEPSGPGVWHRVRALTSATATPPS